MLEQIVFTLPLTHWLLIITSFLASFLAAVAGLGGGILMLAAMVSVFPPTVVIPLHGAVQLGSNGFRALIMRHYIHKEIILAFTVGSLIAALAGANLVVSLNEQLLQIILGLFILFMVWGPKFKAVKNKGKMRFYLGGGISTLASFFIGASGPITAAFMGREALGKHPKLLPMPQ